MMRMRCLLATRVGAFTSVLDRLEGLSSSQRQLESCNLRRLADAGEYCGRMIRAGNILVRICDEAFAIRSTI
jgi:hypothetical protein